MPSYGLFVAPSVQLLRSPIPVRDDIAHITDENRVVCQIEQASLLRSLSYFDLEGVAGLNEISLDPPPDGSEPGKKRRKQHEDEKMREIIACYVETVKRLDEKIGVGKAGENNGKYCWSDPCIPNGYSNGKNGERICHIAEVEALQKKRLPERHGDGKRRKTIAKEGRADNLQLAVRSGHSSPRLDCVRAGFPNRLSKERHHSAEGSAGREGGVLAGGSHAIRRTPRCYACLTA